MEKCFRAGISVRLENTPCFPVRIVSCSTKRGSDLCRMVSVIVYNVKSVFVSFVLEAPVCTGKGKEPFLDLFHRDIQKLSGCDGRQGVGDIVDPVYRKADLSGRSAMDEELERRIAHLVICNIRSAVIGVLIFCVISDDAAWKIGCDFLETVNLSVDDQSPVFREQFCECMEGITDIVDIFEKVHMIFFDIQDDADLWKKVVIAVCIFTGLGHEDF